LRAINLTSSIRKILAAATIATLSTAAASAQSQTEPLQDSIQQMQKQMSELKSMLEEMKAEIQRSRSETVTLRQELETTRGQLATALGNLPGASSQNQSSEQSIEKLEEDQQLLNAKVEEQFQTKVESSSKYRVRFSGLVLMNTFANRGSVDNIDFPAIVETGGSIYSNRGNVGATLRQSLLGFDVFGPQIKGGRVTADIQFDFAGGFPNTGDGVTFGLPRLRTANVRWAWAKTTVAAGQDVPFISPLSPSSLATIALPALSYSGNLWTWIPQIRIEHRLDLTEKSNILVQGGVLDPLTGTPPSNQFLRTAQAGEGSRQPAYGTRIAWTHQIFGHAMTLGAGGFSSQQNWFYRRVHAWAGTSDWTVPLGDRWELSGELYRGLAIGGLGGGLGNSVLITGPLNVPATRVRPINAAGGWAQIKFRQTQKLEWNGALGQDNPYAKDLRFFPFAQTNSYYDSSLARNRSALVNFIYKPRSDVLLSVEYRRLRTFMLQGTSQKADHVNVSMGVVF
jgi:hypothetical protein